MKIKKLDILIVGLFVALLVLQFIVLGVAFEQQALSDKLIRMHVIANSNTAEDQKLKLEVRDAVNEYLSNNLELCSDKTAAADVILSDHDGVVSVVENTVSRYGCDYDVDVVLSEEYYPTREYSDFTLPAGKYTSLQIKLGDAVGDNWWCVVFPPLCTAAAAEEDLTELYFTDDEIKYITLDNGKVAFKFKLLEIISSISKRF